MSATDYRPANLRPYDDIQSWGGFELREQAGILYHQRHNMTQDQYIELAQPLLDEVNRRGADIAKRHGKRFKPYDYTWLNNAAT